MKYGFSTLGCPSWDFKEVFTSAKDLGYNGVEVRGISDELYAPAIKQFAPEKIVETAAYLSALNIEIPILSSSAEIAKPGMEAKAYKEAAEYIDLAAALKTPYVRILCTNSPAPDGGDLEIARKGLKKIADYGKKKGVMPLIETNGIFADTSLLAAFMSSLKTENAGILWDLHHPYRYNQETPEKTVANIGKYIKYVHVKDSVMDNGKLVYKMVGYGDVPVKDAIVKLSNIGYEGYLTLEWVKRWNKNLEEPGVALCQYIALFRRS